ncbi:hypothetical protein H2248_009930 [Termitomyces sp. 'cryptogamus']|nr:hypothetical protein H2248_009930 [Termitomyces sp. 'cryptogamus']
MLVRFSAFSFYGGRSSSSQPSVCCIPTHGEYHNLVSTGEPMSRSVVCNLLPLVGCLLFVAIVFGCHFSIEKFFSWTMWSDSGKAPNDHCHCNSSRQLLLSFSGLLLLAWCALEDPP